MNGAFRQTILPFIGRLLNQKHSLLDVNTERRCLLFEKRASVAGALAILL